MKLMYKVGAEVAICTHGKIRSAIVTEVTYNYVYKAYMYRVKFTNGKTHPPQLHACDVYPAEMAHCVGRDVTVRAKVKAFHDGGVQLTVGGMVHDVPLMMLLYCIVDEHTGKLRHSVYDMISPTKVLSTLSKGQTLLLRCKVLGFGIGDSVRLTLPSCDKVPQFLLPSFTTTPCIEGFSKAFVHAPKQNNEKVSAK